MPITGTPTTATVTATVSVSPTALAGSPTPAGTAEASTCDHPYYPVKEDAQWVYQVTYKTGDAPTSTYTETRSSTGANTFTERRVFNGLTTETDWNCTSDGLVSTQFANLALAGQEDQFTIETVNVRGVTVPAANSLTAGATWTNGYDLKGTMTSQGASTSFEGTVETANEIVGEESVTTPAGTFTALKIESTTTMTLSTKVGDSTVPVEFKFNTTSWFARDTGMVKSVTSGAFGEVTIELISFTE
jgi:hypothetical protein